MWFFSCSGRTYYCLIEHFCAFQVINDGGEPVRQERSTRDYIALAIAMTLLYPVIGIFYSFCLGIKMAHFESVVKWCATRDENGQYQRDNCLTYLLCPLMPFWFLALLILSLEMCMLVGAFGWFFLMYRLAFVSHRISPEP